MNTSRKVKRLYKLLLVQPRVSFPRRGNRLEVSCNHGVYIIYRGRTVVHVGRSTRGKKGLWQRLNNHLNGQSSFVKNHLRGRKNELRTGYGFRCIEEGNDILCAYLECLTVGLLCPEYIGTGRKKVIE